MLLIATLLWTVTSQCTQKWDPDVMKPVERQLRNGTSIMCKSIVEKPRLGIRNKLCLCNNGKWQPLGYGGADGQVDIQFFGDILGAAKQLCAIFQVN